MSGIWYTRQGAYPPIQQQSAQCRSSYVASASQPDDTYYEEISRYEENYQANTYYDELRRSLLDLHEDCRNYLESVLGVDPDAHGNYLAIAENIYDRGYDAFGLMISQDQALIYQRNREVQEEIRSMVQQYHDFPLDIVNNFNPLPRQPRE